MRMKTEPFAQARRAVLSGFLLCMLAAADSTTDAPAVGAPRTDWRLPLGESLVYRVYWGIIPIGKVRIVAHPYKQDGRDLLAVRYRARSNRVLAMLYPVDDTFEALIDPATMLPIRFSIYMQEGRHRKYEVTTFDHAGGTATINSLLKNKTERIPIDSDTRELMTFLYYMRKYNVEPGKEMQFRVMADEKIYDLWLKTRDYEKLSLPGFGPVQCMKIEPNAAFNGLFVRKGKMLVWTSNDKRNIFTRVEASLPVANVKAILTEVYGPPDDFWAKRTAELVREKKLGQDDSEVENSLRELDNPDFKMPEPPAPKAGKGNPAKENDDILLPDTAKTRETP
jgi:hypothetical protein